jgi:hypothetical protein
LNFIQTATDGFRQFGHADFDYARLDFPASCPIRGCSAALVDVPYRQRTKKWCPEHGIRLHSGTFVYWNGLGQEDEARLRNFIVNHDLVRAIALRKGMKAESHRLGYEMSEDALSWNVFVSLAQAGRLREVAEFLTGRQLRGQPSLYLWGRPIDAGQQQYPVYEPLLRVREVLERDIHTYATEPDIMLVSDNEMIICIEAKFGSGNPLAHGGAEKEGEKPTTRAALLGRYLGKQTDGIVQPDLIRGQLHSQLFRNVVFASRMSEIAGNLSWHVTNLVSRAQKRADNNLYSFADPTEAVRSYLHPQFQNCFTYRTWEALHGSLISHDHQLMELDRYMRNKSAHYRRAFELT